MMYLKFESLEQAVTVIESAGYKVSEYQDHFSSKRGWGTILQIPSGFVQDGDSIVPSEFEICANYYGDDRPGDLVPFEIDAPTTPYNVIA